MSRSLVTVLMLAAPARARAERIAVADLHAEGDLRDEAVGISVVVADGLTRTGNIEVAGRADLIDAFEGAKLPPRTGLWLSPTEARAVAATGHYQSVLLGTLRRDAAAVYVTLHLVDFEGKVTRTAKLVHPLRHLATLPGAVLEKAGKWFGTGAGGTEPVMRRMTLAALGRAWIAVQKKDLEAAVAELERASHGALPAPLLAALVSRVRTVGEGEALRVRALIAFDPKGALAEAEKFAAENPSLLAARLLHARALIALDRRQEALVVLKPRSGEPEVSELHALRGAALQGDQARKELRKAVELNGDNVEALYLLGEHLAAGTRYAMAGDPRAVSELLQADPRLVDPTQLLPADASALAQARAGSYAHALYKALLGDLPGATRELEVAPKEDASSRLLGLLEAEQGHHEAAMTALARVAPLDAGREARAAGQPRQAQDLLARAVTVAASEPVATRDLGELLLESGDAAGAVARLRRAVAVMPDDAEAHALLGRALGAAGDSQGASAETRLAAAIDPDLTAPVVPAAKSVMRAATPSRDPDLVQLGEIAAGVVLVGILIIVVRRRRAHRRDRVMFAAQSPAEKAPVVAKAARAREVPTARPPSNETLPTAPDPPSMPGMAALLIEVVGAATVEIPGSALTMSEKRPLIGATVWVGDDEAGATRTEKASGGAVLYVPPGEHTLHVRAGGKLLEQVLTVLSPKRVALTVDMADEVVVARPTKA